MQNTSDGYGIILWLSYIIAYSYNFGEYDFYAGIIKASDYCEIPRSKIYTLIATIFTLDILTFYCF